MAACTLIKYATADQTVGNLIPGSGLVTAVQNKTPIFGMSLQMLFGCSNGKSSSTVADPRPVTSEPATHLRSVSKKISQVE